MKAAGITCVDGRFLVAVGVSPCTPEVVAQVNALAAPRSVTVYEAPPAWRC